jgi:hypothetical protein
VATAANVVPTANAQTTADTAQQPVANTNIQTATNNTSAPATQTT